MDIPKVVLSSNNRPYKLDGVSVCSDKESNLVLVNAIYRKMGFLENKIGARRLAKCKNLLDCLEEGISIAWDTPHYLDPSLKTISVMWSIIPNNGRIVYFNGLDKSNA